LGEHFRRHTPEHTSITNKVSRTPQYSTCGTIISRTPPFKTSVHYSADFPVFKKNCRAHVFTGHSRLQSVEPVLKKPCRTLVVRRVFTGHSRLQASQNLYGGDDANGLQKVVGVVVVVMVLVVVVVVMVMVLVDIDIDTHMFGNYYYCYYY
jgi:hypothetical protein